MLKLRELRKRTGITMKDLGEAVGLAESTISHYETGKRQPDYETLLKFSEFFGVSVDYLLTGNEKEKTPAPEDEHEIGFDNFTYAFYKESKDLPEEKKKMLLDMARFMKADMEKEKG